MTHRSGAGDPDGIAAIARGGAGPAMAQACSREDPVVSCDAAGKTCCQVI
jgi:hypothetical protein